MKQDMVTLLLDRGACLDATNSVPGPCIWSEKQLQEISGPIPYSPPQKMKLYPVIYWIHGSGRALEARGTFPSSAPPPGGRWEHHSTIGLAAILPSSFYTPPSAPTFPPLRWRAVSGSVPPSSLDGLCATSFSFWQSHVSGRGRAAMAVVLALVTIHSIS